VVLFLILAALIGIGINFLKTKSSCQRIADQIFADIGKINLNTADKELLMSVSGIGVRLAERIIEYRKINGNFQDPSDLKNIKGINDYRIEKIKDYLIVK